MKKTGTIIWLPLTVVFFISTAFISIQSSTIQNPGPEEGLVIPDDVNQILEKSCFGCHNMESSNEKGKKKLIIDELANLSKTKLIGALGDIGEVVEKNEMPPEKFLAKYPDKALTDAEAQRLKKWAEDVVDGMMP